ncbi:uncharacterized protein METZ01_LOCUS30787 [marine metagenome]|uniref:Uncharacterized protein n=1 Tax=marine metagenome TaxID=408172 RepID=A0A381QJZ5_9ZZZZ
MGIIIYLNDDADLFIIHDTLTNIDSQKIFWLIAIKSRKE